MLTLSHHIEKDICILSFEGQLMGPGTLLAEEYINEQLNDLPLKAMIFNLEALTQVDSMGYGLFNTIHHQMVDQHKKFALCGLKSYVKEVLTRICLDQIMSIYDTESDALKAFS